jgi:hypothetical protein
MAVKSDTEIISDLEQAAQGLLFMSESDFPFRIVRWEGLREITAQYLREVSGQSTDAPVQALSVDDFFRAATTEREGQSAEALDTVNRFRKLLGLLKDDLEEVKIYKLGTIDVPVYIVGRSPAGTWMGLSTRVIET